MTAEEQERRAALLRNYQWTAEGAREMYRSPAPPASWFQEWTNLVWGGDYGNPDRIW